MSQNEMSDVKRNPHYPGILPTSNALELLKRRAEEHKQKTQHLSLNLLAHQLQDQCKAIETICQQLLDISEANAPGVTEKSQPVTYEQLEQYLHILAARYDYDPGPKEVARCMKLVADYPATSVYKAFVELYTGQHTTGRLSTEDFCYRVQVIDRERRGTDL